MKVWKLTSTAIILVMSTNVNASLIGDEMTANWRHDSTGYFNTNTFVVSDGVDLIGEFGDMNLDVTETSIIVDNIYGFGIGAGVTWEFLDIDYMGGGEISDVIVNTNYEGWSDSFLSFDSHNITVNFTNTVYWDFRTDFFELIITPVPIPAAIWLFGSGLIGLMGIARRKKYKLFKC